MAIFLEKLQKDFGLLSKAFHCFRLIDTHQQRMVAEHFNNSYISHPYAFDYTIFMDEYEKSIMLDAAIYRIRQHVDSVWLYLIVPIYIKNRNHVLECSIDVTESISIEQIQGLLCNTSNLSFIDELTGIFNRRYINVALPRAISLCAEKQVPLSIIFMDLDFFKEINDSYGHAAGDCFLEQIALDLQCNIRQDTDWVARYGGDEFIICLVGTNESRAKAMAERVRKSVEDMKLSYRDKDLKTTCSLGTYTIDSFDDIPSHRVVLDAVDRRLYEAKYMGRNQVQ